MEQVATPKSSCTASPLLDVANSSVGETMLSIHHLQ